jgi:thiamine-monophosphate kinase
VGSPKPGHTEDEIVELIRRTLGGGIGEAALRDDAASVAVPGGGSLVVSIDSVVEGVHVDLALCRPADVGWKALMGALSDLAAMGARPVGALVALCVPESVPSAPLDQEDAPLALGVMAGVAEAAAASGCPVVGGDVSMAAQLVVTVTVLGSTDGAAPVTRSGARPGDVVLVTGPCGRSAAGLRQLRAGPAGEELPLATAYRRPVARIEAGLAVRRAGGHAMIDVSDGLSLDLHRLADASAVGFSLTDIPVADGATLEEALGGGEDYELVLTTGAADVDRLMEQFSAAALPPPIPIGVITAQADQRLLGPDDLVRRGWQHRLG